MYFSANICKEYVLLNDLLGFKEHFSSDVKVLTICMM